MKKRILGSFLLLISLVFLLSCSGKKDESQGPGETSITPETTVASTTSAQTAPAEETSTGAEEDVTPEYVDDYTVEVKEDEIIVIH